MTGLDPTRMPELMSHDRSQLDELLADTAVAHVAYIDERGMPGVLPTGVARVGDDLVVHGSTGSRWMRLVAGAPAAVSITAVDGVVVARSAFESSIAYRSAVVFGSFRVLDGEEKLEALDALTERLLPGRVAEVRRPTKKELAATLVLAMPLDSWSLRISNGWPDDVDDDLPGDAWAGIAWFGERPVTASVAPDVRGDIPVPHSVSGLRARH